MTRATLTRPTDPTTASLGAGTMSVARHDLGSPPDGGLRGVGAETNHSIRKASTTAGVGLLAMSVLSAFGYLVAVKGLVVPGNAARTAKNIADHEGLFRFGILSLYLVAALDVVVAWALYRVFKPVSDALSKFAAWLRIAYAGVFMVAISQLFGALGLHSQALAAHQLLHQHLGRWARPLRPESVCPGLPGLQVGLCPEAAGRPARHRGIRLCVRHRRPRARPRLLVRCLGDHGHG